MDTGDQMEILRFIGQVQWSLSSGAEAEQAKMADVRTFRDSRIVTRLQVGRRTSLHGTENWQRLLRYRAEKKLKGQQKRGSVNSPIPYAL